MKLVLIFSILGLSPLFSQTTETPTSDPIQTQAQKTDLNDPASSEKRNSNEITVEIIKHIKAIFTASSTAIDEKSATAAIKNINESTEKILSLKELLEATEKPTAEEKKQCAVHMLKSESEISEILKKMSQTFDNNQEEINKLIEPPLSKSKAKIAPTMMLINRYYPHDEMLGYINALKESK